MEEQQKNETVEQEQISSINNTSEEYDGEKNINTDTKCDSDSDSDSASGSDSDSDSDSESETGSCISGNETKDDLDELMEEYENCLEKRKRLRNEFKESFLLPMKEINTRIREAKSSIMQIVSTNKDTDELNIGNSTILRKTKLEVDKKSLCSFLKEKNMIEECNNIYGEEKDTIVIKTKKRKI